ncbi:MAG: hypothetical protein J5722_04735, partial [Oscillospiraceae bacterium]|nr:hypothetical protein [Oscillospiraceae bacterium]
MNHAHKRILSIFAAAALSLCSLPQSTPLLLRPAITANAAYSDSCGENLKWEYDAEMSKLTITGTGDMYNYSNLDHQLFAPWEMGYYITTIIIEKGVTSIGDYA